MLMEHARQRPALAPPYAARHARPQNLHTPRISVLYSYRVAKELTSISLFFSPGFLMYHVEVRKVSAKMTISFFPESSRLCGVDLLTDQPLPRS